MEPVATKKAEVLKPVARRVCAINLPLSLQILANRSSFFRVSG
jgi:hypothetical protein